ncbi:hypothetical protein niasHS_003088 [Heterodera schachtii]|uniref:Uncharacterized protein n=1 Tax=Heterodera schachtii TaxID=97005 RepID=A0ABD2K9M6_HETSC
MTDITNNTLYLAFKNVNHSWSLIGCALSYGIVTIFGIIFNSSVIGVTYLTKSFRGTVNYLLALCSFFEMLHQFGHFLFVYTAFSGQNFIVYRLAIKIVMVPLFGFGGIPPIMLFIGIDRMIGIVFGEMDSKCKIRLYLATITIICSAFSLVYSNLIKPSIASPITAWFATVISGITLNIGAASNAPILYFTSTEYRQAFQTVFPFLFKRFSNKKTKELISEKDKEAQDDNQSRLTL